MVRRVLSHRPARAPRGRLSRPSKLRTSLALLLRNKRESQLPLFSIPYALFSIQVPPYPKPLQHLANSFPETPRGGGIPQTQTFPKPKPNRITLFHKSTVYPL